MALVDDVKSMSDVDLSWTLSVITQEIAVRREVAGIPVKMESLNREFLAASGVSEGADWVQPTGAHDAYPAEWVVSHGGKMWESLIPANVWEPGVSGWREQVAVVEPDPDADPDVPPAPPVYPDWVQPAGAHDAYSKGFQVAHEASNWVSDVDGNVWEPGVYGWTSL